MPFGSVFQSLFAPGGWFGAAGGIFHLAAEAPSAVPDETQVQFTVSIVRLAAVLICPGIVWLLWNSTILTERKRNAAIIAGILRCLFSLVADLALVHAGIYKYRLEFYLYQGVPVDLHIVMGCLVGTGLCLLWEQGEGIMRVALIVMVAALGVIFNRWCVGSLHVIAPIAPEYQTYDLIVQCALPVIAALFYKLVDENRALILRSVIYALGYFVLFYFLIPSMILSIDLGNVIFPASKWRIAAVAVAVLSVPGAWAAGQFAVSGRGTPLPLDPTHKLIVTGPYAYVRNPMQISGVGVSVVWAATTMSTALWIYVGVLLVGLQFLRVYEEDNLHRRFGERYKRYCRNVWLWLPRLWAYEEDDGPPAGISGYHAGISGPRAGISGPRARVSESRSGLSGPPSKADSQRPKH